MTAAICTCQWSRVSTVTEDPPHIVRIDPGCPRHGELVDEYDGQKDLAGSLEEGYRAIRERMAKGGPGWERK